MHPGFTAVSGYQGHSPKDGAGAAGAGHVKAEPNFNLYGYQPYRPTFISQEKLYEAAKHSPVDKTALASPPPLLSTTEGYSKPSSVIVENKGKERADLSSHHHGGSITLGTAMSPRHQGARDKPVAAAVAAHTNSVPAHSASPRSPHHAYMHGQQQVQEAAYNMSVGGGRGSSGAASTNGPINMNKLGKSAMARTQSPLRVASPQQLSAAIMQPMELPKDGAGVAAMAAMQHRPAAMKLSPKAVAGRASPGRSPGAVHRQPHPASLPESSMAAAYCYSLIQQGLVPNPIYTQTNTTHKAAAPGQSWPSDSSHDASRMLSMAAAQMAAAANQSKRPQKEQLPDADRKKLKTETPPATTAVTVTSSYSIKPPYIVTMSVDNMGRESHTYMDSFKSFVENAVQSVFLQDQERERQRDMTRSSAKSPPSKYVSPPNLQPVSLSTTASTTSCTGTSCSTATTTSTALIFATQSMHETMPRLTVSHTTSTPPPPGVTSSTVPPPVPASSSSSIMDTINRVANGYADTDSDTLSASSPPPPPLKVDVTAESIPTPATSPLASQRCGGESHKMGKKAWLQRYSDEDRLVVNNDLETGEEAEVKTEPLKDCYVNCSYISPTKDGSSKSPISMMRDLSGKTEDESTSSASESESQVSLSGCVSLIH